MIKDSPLILWLLISALETVRHLIYIATQHKSPRKWLSLTLRFIVGSSILLYDLRFGYRPPEVTIAAYLFSAVWIHDTFMSLGLSAIFSYRKFIPWYVNKKGYFDKPQNSYAPYIWVLKTIAAVTTTLMYFINDY